MFICFIVWGNECGWKGGDEPADVFSLTYTQQQEGQAPSTAAAAAQQQEGEGGQAQEPAAVSGGEGKEGEAAAAEERGRKRPRPPPPPPAPLQQVCAVLCCVAACLPSRSHVWRNERARVRAKSLTVVSIN